jgi:hypothetical protein
MTRAQKQRSRDRGPLGRICGEPLRSFGRIVWLVDSLCYTKWSTEFMQREGYGLLHCCWSAKNSRSTSPIKTLANMVSAVVIFSTRGTREAKSMVYVGVVTRKSRTLCAREIKATLKTKKSAGPIFARSTFLRDC